MLISLRAGGTGLNLTAADHVYLLDPWWNPAVEDQAADRAHRIGQDKPVLVHRLVARDTVEERILALQERKRALAEAAVQGGAAAGITKDELLDLLG
jgi:SNF2 family DNA or RNA helicase